MTVSRPFCKGSALAGFTLPETIIATAVAMLAMAGAAALNTAHLRLVKSGRQSNAATLTLQERVEQMRVGEWRDITDPDYLKGTLLANPPRSAAPLDQLTETITVTAYPDPTAAQKLVVERQASGECVTLVSGDGLTARRLAQVEFQAEWRGADGRRRSRATTTVISNGGINRSSLTLPGFGGALGELPPVNDPTTPPDDSGDPAGDDTPANPPPAQNPEPADNGNKGGRGNSGGKPGKK